MIETVSEAPTTLANEIAGKPAEAFDERPQDRLILRAATIDEVLTDAFEPAPGRHEDTDLVARRLSAWCRAGAAGDQALFERRLARDGWSYPQIRERLGTVRRSADAATPAWVADALWIEVALQRPAQDVGAAARGVAGEMAEGTAEPVPFQQLFAPVVAQAQTMIWAGIDARTAALVEDTARISLGQSLLNALSDLGTAALYERFAKARSDRAATAGASTGCYDRFIAEMRTDGFRRLFADKPVLLRLLATITRQWIDTSREFVLRLATDGPAIRDDLLQTSASCHVAKIESDLSDRHNGGRSVLIVTFEDGARVVYKPKDLRVDVAWYGLIRELNAADTPVDLKALRTIRRDGYGWTEFVDHSGCADQDGCEQFFRRAGAWLALLHCFAATDMHQENIIATGEHPVPIDLETILQPAADEHKALDLEGQAFDAALDIIANSVMTVGLLPAHGRSVDNHVFTMGGLTPDWGSRTVVKWNDINADAMRPIKTKEQTSVTTNLPHVGGRYATFGEHFESFIAGFEDYARFLLRLTQSVTPVDLFEGFAGLPVRKVIRPTRFYYMLLQRLKDHRTMDDGAAWSAQADFVARLSEWDKDHDPLWPLYRAERGALLALNVPHFTTPSDGGAVGDIAGVSVETGAASGLRRARERVQALDEREIAWQVEVIRENTRSALPQAGQSPVPAPLKLHEDAAAPPPKQIFIAEADRIAAELSRLAIRRGPGAAWIGLDWLGDAEVFQLVCLGPDLYNGTTGIALFLAAHAAATGAANSGDLALAGLSHIRKNLKGGNAARIARSLGIGGGTGLGSIVYAFAVVAACLRNDALLADAHEAANLFTDDLIAADKRLDVMSGSAGAILALLRLYRDTQSGDILTRAMRCGEHLSQQTRLGAAGSRSWIGEGLGAHALNGMSHGAAGFAYALASLAAAAGREDFAEAAAECLAFENSSYDAARHNWPDLRGGQPLWPSQWCHGATGIGLARLAMAKRGAASAKSGFGPVFGKLDTDIRNALEGAERNRTVRVDTLCCGGLGNIEFFCEAGDALHRDDLRELAAQQLKSILDRAAAAGDYRWNSGKGRFNLGLFRGLSGVGYTLLRQSGAALPNVVIWE